MQSTAYSTSTSIQATEAEGLPLSHTNVLLCMQLPVMLK